MLARGNLKKDDKHVNINFEEIFKEALAILNRNNI